MTRLARKRPVIPWTDFQTLFGTKELLLTLFIVAIIVMASERARIFGGRNQDG
jgi:hypothetical protein